MKLSSRCERATNGAWMMRPQVLHGGSVRGLGRWGSERSRIERHWRMGESGNIQRRTVLIAVCREGGS